MIASAAYPICHFPRTTWIDFSSVKTCLPIKLPVWYGNGNNVLSRWKLFCGVLFLSKRLSSVFQRQHFPIKIWQVAKKCGSQHENQFIVVVNEVTFIYRISEGNSSDSMLTSMHSHFAYNKAIWTSILISEFQFIWMHFIFADRCFFLSQNFLISDLFNDIRTIVENGVVAAQSINRFRLNLTMEEKELSVF